MWLLLTSLLLASNDATQSPKEEAAEKNVKSGVKKLHAAGGVGNHVCVVPAPSKKINAAPSAHAWPSLGRGESVEAAKAAAIEDCLTHHDEKLCKFPVCVLSSIQKTSLEVSKTSVPADPNSKEMPPPLLHTHRIGNPTLDYYAQYIELGSTHLHIAHASTLLEAQALALQNCLALKKSDSNCKLTEQGHMSQKTKVDIKPIYIPRSFKIKVQRKK